MSDSQNLQLAELLCARLCHDMAGAVGAAAAGAELLEDGYDAETAQLVAASAAGAVARLKFFRAALGPAGTEQPSAVIYDLASAYLRAAEASGGGSLVLRWGCQRPRLDGETARLVLNMILVARDALLRGGQISVEIAPARPPTGAGVTIAYKGPGARLSDELTQALTTTAPPSGPRGAQAGFTRVLAANFGGTPRLEGGSDHGLIAT